MKTKLGTSEVSPPARVEKLAAQKTIALLVMLSLSAALSGCATTTTPAAYDAKYPMCAGVPAGFLGCK